MLGLPGPPTQGHLKTLRGPGPREILRFFEALGPYAKVGPTILSRQSRERNEAPIEGEALGSVIPCLKTSLPGPQSVRLLFVGIAGVSSLPRSSDLIKRQRTTFFAIPTDILYSFLFNIVPSTTGTVEE
ncbi:hypothetical protein TNCV_4857981 [Trichonephila clavipes]|nr:hypothetical protein TNCV_4857981 [Trichonephila clavipes]